MRVFVLQVPLWFNSSEADVVGLLWLQRNGSLTLIYVLNDLDVTLDVSRLALTWESVAVETE